MKTPQQELPGVILVLIPHTLPARAYGFETQAEFESFVTGQLHGSDRFSWQSYDWEAWCATYGYPDFIDPEREESFKEGKAMFEAGAKRIVEWGADEISRKPEADAPTQTQYALELLGYDMHGAYTLTHSEFVEVHEAGEPIMKHQAQTQLRVIRNQAILIGWIQ